MHVTMWMMGELWNYQLTVISLSGRQKMFLLTSSLLKKKNTGNKDGLHDISLLIIFSGRVFSQNYPAIFFSSGWKASQQSSHLFLGFCSVNSSASRDQERRDLLTSASRIVSSPSPDRAEIILLIRSPQLANGRPRFFSFYQLPVRKTRR